MTDIFDKIAPDIFDSLEAEDSSVEKLKSQLSDVLGQFDDKTRKKEHAKLKAEFEKTLKEEISKIKPVQHVVERVIEKQVKPVPVHLEPRIIQAPPAPPQIIRQVKEIRVEVPKPDTRKLVEEKDLKGFKETIANLEQEIKSLKEVLPFLHGGSGVIGIPPPEGSPDNNVLTVSGGKAVWKKSSSGGSSSDAYTPTNVVTDRSYDASSTTLNEIANVLGSLIASLQGAGIIQ